MNIIKLDECEEIIAGDHTILKEILNPLKTELDIRYSLAHAILPPGKSSDLHSLTTTEVFYIISGRAVMHIDNEKKHVGPGDTVYIPKNSKQFLFNDSNEPLVFIAIVDPAWRKDDETVY